MMDEAIARELRSDVDATLKKIRALRDKEREYVASGNWERATTCTRLRLAEQAKFTALQMRLRTEEVF